MIQFDRSNPAALTSLKISRLRPDILREFRNSGPQSFDSLQARFKHGRDFEIKWQDRRSEIAVVAPHGGNMEVGTTEIAKALADPRLSYYIFNSLLAPGNMDMHLTSRRFDEPTCISIVRQAQTVVTVHGCDGELPGVHIGGRDDSLKALATTCLKGYREMHVWDARHIDGIKGEHPNNICNRGLTGRGLQLEFTAAYRAQLLSNVPWALALCRSLNTLLYELS